MSQDILGKLGVNINVTFSLVFISLIWMRVLTMASIIPFLLGKPVPRYVVVGASVVMALFVYSNIAPANPPLLTEEPLQLVALYLKEAFYGLAIGFGVSALFYGFESAGQMIDNQRGVSIARLLIPQLGTQGSISGQLLFQMSIVLYLTMGGHRLFFNSFFLSFSKLPILEFPATTGPGFFPLMDIYIKITGEVLLISIQLAAPVIIAILITDIILGMANRVAPQINVWELGFNVKGYIGILMLFLSITVVGDQIVSYAQRSNTNADAIIKQLKTPSPVPQIDQTIGPEDGRAKPEQGLLPVVSP